MRISSAQIFQQNLSSMLRQQAQLHETELQLGSGLRVMRPSDDPSAAVKILNLEDNLAALDQFARNTAFAETSLGIGENALQGVSDGIQRIRELAVQANNGTWSDADRRSIALEVGQRLDELLALANSRDGNGEYIFAGNRVDGPAFAHSGGVIGYQGDQGQRFLQVGEGAQVAVRDSGREVFQEIPDGSGGRLDLFALVQSLRTTLDTPRPAAADRTAFHAEMAAALGGLDRALDHVSNHRAEIGARLNTVDTMKNVNADFSLQLEGVLSDTRDLDYAEAISRFNRQLTSLQAAQQVFVKTAGLSLFQYL